MTQSDKELLLKDLCARLPYGVKVEVPSGIRELTAIDICSEYVNHAWPFLNYKPYLRPMSSMTEEELDTMWNIWEQNSASEAASKITDFLNGRFLDHHQLIEKGLALEAPEGMYKIK